MKSHIIGFLLVTLAQILMPIKIGTTFQNKLLPFGQQLSASHVLLQLSNLCQAFLKKFKVLNTRAFSLLPVVDTH